MSYSIEEATKLILDNKELDNDEIMNTNIGVMNAAFWKANFIILHQIDRKLDNILNGSLSFKEEDD